MAMHKFWNIKGGLMMVTYIVQRYIWIFPPRWEYHYGSQQQLSIKMLNLLPSTLEYWENYLSCHPPPLPQITVSKSYLWAIPGSMACFSNRKIKCSWINSLFLEYWNITISAPDAKCWLRTIHAYKTDFKDNALIQHSNIGSQSYLVNVKRMCRRIHKEEKEFIIWLSANKIKWILKAFPSIVATTRTLLDQSLIRYLIKWVYIPLYACEILNGH